jgi:type II secretory pathway predicted ATPase ExeA
MSASYRAFFGLKKEPFPLELPLKDIYQTSDLGGVVKRFEYVVRLGAMALVTGEIGSGKSTALRFAASKLHPSQYRAFHLTASSGSILEFYRLLLGQLGIETSSFSRAVLIRAIKREVRETADAKKIKPVLIIDEASLMRLDVFAELHTITDFESDPKVGLPIILAGQSNLIDKLSYRTSKPLASRIVARTHLEGMDRQEMEQYLKHHLHIAGLKNNPFQDPAITAIHQGSGGLLRKANHLARGALIAAAEQKESMVSAEHVRMAATEVF